MAEAHGTIKSRVKFSAVGKFTSTPSLPCPPESLFQNVTIFTDYNGHGPFRYRWEFLLHVSERRYVHKTDAVKGFFL